MTINSRIDYSSYINKKQGDKTMKVDITESGNFVLVSEGYYATAITRPYLNHCTFERRAEKKKDCENYNLSSYYEKTYGNGMFEGYDYGHDLGIDDPYAQEFLNSNVLLQ